MKVSGGDNATNQNTKRRSTILDLSQGLKILSWNNVAKVEWIWGHCFITNEVSLRFLEVLIIPPESKE